MRTTVEISDEQHEALVLLARRRGLRGFSQLVQEALDAYVADLAPDEVDSLLALRGSLSDDEADEMGRRIDEARATWRAS